MAGAKPGTKVAVRNARGQFIAHVVVTHAGKAEAKIPTTHLTAGRHGFTVTFVDTAARHHTKNIKVRVTAGHR